MRELAEIVAETVPGCKVEYAADASPDKRCYRVNCDKIARVLPAFQPQWDAKKGARELYEVYKKVGLTLEEFEGPKFQRIGHIRKLIEDGIIDAKLRHTATKRAKAAGLRLVRGTAPEQLSALHENPRRR